MDYPTNEFVLSPSQCTKTMSDNEMIVILFTFMVDSRNKKRKCNADKTSSDRERKGEIHIHVIKVYITLLIGYDRSNDIESYLYKPPSSN